MLVEGVDGGARLLDRVAVQRAPFAQVHPPLHLALAQPVYSPNSPLLQDRPFLDPNDQDETPPGVMLLDQHVIELAGPEQRGDGALDVAIIDGLMNDDA